MSEQQLRDRVTRLENEVGNLQMLCGALAASVATLAAGKPLPRDVLENLRDSAHLVLGDMRKNG